MLSVAVCTVVAALRKLALSRTPVGIRPIASGLGARKWAPRFHYILEQMAYTAIDDGKPLDKGLVERFKGHTIHPVLKACAEMRPAVDISVS